MSEIQKTEISMELTSEELDTVAGGATARRATAFTVNNIEINEQASVLKADRNGVASVNTQFNFQDDLTAAISEDTFAG